MAEQRTVIRGGQVLTMAGVDSRPVLADVLIEDGRIAAIGPDLPVPPDTETVDATGRLVLPGLVDTHRHSWQTVLRHTGATWSLSDYLDRMLRAAGDVFRPVDVYVGTLLGALTALDAGITTMVDWAHIQNGPAYADQSIRALTDAGIRAVFAHGWPVGAGMDPTAPHPADVRRIRRELPTGRDARITLALGVRGPDFTSMDITTADFALARELEVPITVHVASGAHAGPGRGIEKLGDAGLLGPDVTLVHATAASDEAIGLIVEHDVAVSVSPQIELTMPELGADAEHGGGTALGRLLAAGVRPGLSVDSETAATGDLFTQMRFALAAHRVESGGDEPRLTPAEVLRMATADGARTAGLADRVGTLEVGKAADVVLLSMDDVNLTPAGDPAAAVVQAAHPGNVDTVFVGGEIRKHDGRLVADLAPVRRLVAESAAYLRSALS